MRILRILLVEIVNIIFAVMIAVLMFLALRYYVIQPFQVDGRSMNPTLYDGDQMMMLKQNHLERFDVVVFPDPMGSGQSYVKRIIGIPGDEIQVSDDILYINGKPVEEPYLQPLASQFNSTYTEDFSLWDITGETRVPNGHYFVLGDNRPASGDSRQFGFVAEESIQGEANFIYYPFDRFGFIEDYE